MQVASSDRHEVVEVDPHHLGVARVVEHEVIYQELNTIHHFSSIMCY